MNKKRSTKQSLSRAKIVKIAVRIADENGVDGLSMRKLAQSLNVEAMSLYNHVANKEDLLDGMIDLVVSEFELPLPNKPWRSALRASVISTHDVLLRHPWSALLLLSRINTGQAVMSYTNACFGCLLEAGFSHALTDHGWNAIHNHLYGFTLTEINSAIGPEDYAQAAQRYLPEVPHEHYPHVRSMMEVIIDGSHSGVNDFTFGLDLILEGLNRKLV